MKPAPNKHLMKIAVVTETYPPEVNGVARTVQKMVQGLLARGHRVDLFRPRQKGPALVRNGKLTQHLVAGMHVPFYPEVQIGVPAYRTLVKSWRRNRPDMVHIITEGPLGLAALLAARKLDIPMLSDYRTNYQQYAKHYRVSFVHGFAESYMRRFHNRTNGTLCPTHEMRDYLASRGFQNLSVVGRGVDVAAFSPMHRSAELRKSWNLGRDGRAVLYVGRIAPEKNIDLAIEAFKAMQQVDPKLKMVLVGDGPSRKILEETHPDLIFAGMKRGEELSEYYASGDIFLFPSVTETFGNVILEAVASKLALVSFDYAAAKEKLEDGVSAALAPLGRNDIFIEKACELARDRGLVQDLRREGFAVSKQCSWEYIIRQIEDLYLEHRKPRIQKPTLVPARNAAEAERDPIARIVNS
jgi:glycosyltransferase involved in cell wall biosynthesis